MSADLTDFNLALVEDSRASAEAADVTATEALTQRMVEHLAEAGEIDDATVCEYRTRGLEVSAYGVSTDGTTVDLFATTLRDDTELSTMPGSEVAAVLRRLETFSGRCRDGVRFDVPDGSAAADMVQEVTVALKSATRVRYFVLTNATVRPAALPKSERDGVQYESHVWDLARLNRLLSSGTLHEPIVVDFSRQFDQGLRCLSTPVTDKDYSVLLAIIPGDVLAALYDEHGPRLLELNVRSFLQTTGAVNRGIRESLHRTPERFLAYNNGISATASKVELSPDGTSILRLHDLQIVNGGQTTASIHSAAHKDKVDVSSVLVQAKITVVSPDKLDVIVPAISKYSNTQNKVTTADFSANDAFHVEVEKFSRSVWAPSTGATGQETRWFYERARGQYADELGRHRTPARKKTFREFHPTRQKFTKTDLAKFEATWDQLPHLVSRGAEKNFRDFMVRLSRGRPAVDQIYFQRLVAKAILFRETERIVQAHQFGGYRANIVTYTLARLLHATASKIDLDGIWLRQGLSPALTEAISALSVPVQASVTAPPNGGNVGEWCKKQDAWDRVQKLRWTVPADLKAELVDPRTVTAPTPGPDGQEAAADGSEIARVKAVPGETWFACAKWAKQTNNLEIRQRGVAFSLGQLAGWGGSPSARQATQGLLLIADAVGHGFDPPLPLDPMVLGDG